MKNIPLGWRLRCAARPMSPASSPVIAAPTCRRSSPPTLAAKPAYLDPMRLPSLFVVGAEDAALPVAMMQAMQAEVPGSRFAAIADAFRLRGRRCGDADGGQAAAGFALGLMTKDVKIASELADGIGVPSPIGHLVHDLLARAGAAIGPQADHTKASTCWEQWANAGRP